jgi:hypothetical protein
LDYGIYGSQLKPTIAYQVQTYNIGIFMTSLTFDYSHMKILTEDPSYVNLYTASLTLKKFILTASRRVEESSRPAFNEDLKSLEVSRNKEETFGGVQVWVNNNVMVGIFYNYYLLREYSLAATVFF